MTKPPRRPLPGTMFVPAEIYLADTHENLDDVMQVLRETADKALDAADKALDALAIQGIQIDDLMMENQRLKQAKKGERGVATQSAAFTRLALAYLTLDLDTAPLRKALMEVYSGLEHPDRAADSILKNAKKQLTTKKL